LLETAAEQPKQRLAESEDQRAGCERGPEGPADGLAEKFGEAVLVAGDVILSELVRRGAGNGEIDEGDERQ
jgi:hypothetical protein